MSLQFNNNKIGAMQYNGVTIGEAMIDGKIVYQSAIYPAYITWVGTVLNIEGRTNDEVEIMRHTLVESGNFTVDASVISDIPHGVQISLHRGSSQTILGHASGEGEVTASSGTYDHNNFLAGDELSVFAYTVTDDVPGTASLLITKNY